MTSTRANVQTSNSFPLSLRDVEGYTKKNSTLIFYFWLSAQADFKIALLYVRFFFFFKYLFFILRLIYQWFIALSLARVNSGSFKWAQRNKSWTSSHMSAMNIWNTRWWGEDVTVIHPDRTASVQMASPHTYVRGHLDSKTITWLWNSSSFGQKKVSLGDQFAPPPTAYKVHYIMCRSCPL